MCQKSSFFCYIICGWPLSCKICHRFFYVFSRTTHTHRHVHIPLRTWIWVSRLLPQFSFYIYSETMRNLSGETYPRQAPHNPISYRNHAKCDPEKNVTVKQTVLRGTTRAQSDRNTVPMCVTTKDKRNLNPNPAVILTVTPNLNVIGSG